MFLLKKRVDWSLLTDGFNIPLEFQQLVHDSYSGYIQPGEKRLIKIFIESFIRPLLILIVINWPLYSLTAWLRRLS